MKYCKAILVAAVLAAGSPAWADSYSVGISYLTQTNIPLALSAFGAAASPSAPNAEVYLALTRLLALPNDTATSGFLTELGFSASGRNVYDWQTKPEKDPAGHTVVPKTFQPEDVAKELATDVVPTLSAAKANLAQVTSTGFSMVLSNTVTHFAGNVTIDYGDVQMLQAMLDAETVFAYEISTWNLYTSGGYGAASNAVLANKSIESLLTTYPALLTLTNAGNLALARAAFTNAANEYFAASQFIRGRPAGETRLFNLSANDLTEEASFRTTLANLVSSLNGPVAINAKSTNQINLGAFFSFSTQTNLRTLLPQQASKGATFIWDTFPDTTLGGVITGVTQTNLGKLFIQKLHENAQLALPGATFAVVASPTNLNGQLNGVVRGTDGNLYGTSQYGGTAYFGAVFKTTTSGTFSVIYNFGVSAGQTGNPTDGGGPSGLALGKDGNFYGTTQYGGANGGGTIFKITPTGSLTTLYSFPGGNGQGVTGGNPLVQGTDGNFYGTTFYGGENNGGVIFQFVPATKQFQVVGSFPASPANGFGSSAGAGALVVGTDGNFYGATQFGGDNGAGSLFQFVAGAGQFNSYSFPASAIAYDQYGDPIPLNISTPVQASNGVFYGVTQYGGNNYGNASANAGDGTIFSITTDGQFATLYSFDENHFDGFGPIGPLVQGSNGLLYGITSSGGANEEGTIFQYDPTGNSTPNFLVWFNENLGKQQSEQDGNNGNNGYNSTIYAGLIKGTGQLYGTAPNGNNGGTIYSLSPSGGSSPVPTILGSPVSTSVLKGSPASFTVSASGVTSYQWVKNGAVLANSGDASGVTTATLAFSAVTTADAGSYKVVVSNSSGKATSAVAVLTVTLPPPPPTITSQPKTPLNVAQGGTLNLAVGATGTANLTYQWFAGNAALVDGGNVSGSATSTLVIFPAITANSGIYSVIVGNGSTSVTSKLVVVTVGLPPQVAAAPSVTNLVGSTARLAAVVGASTAPLSFQWRKNGTAPANNVAGATSSTLILPNLTLANTGTYVLVVTNVFGSVTSAPPTVLTVVQGPKIAVQPMAPAGVLQGQKLSLKVTASGSGLAFFWLSNSVYLTDGGAVSGSATSNLVINPAYVSDSGSYTVIVSNNIGAVQSSVVVVKVGAEKTLPTVAIISPIAGARLTAPAVFYGKATDTVQVTNVNYWITNLNGSPLIQGQAALLAGAGGVTDWTFTNSPAAGSNVLAVQSQNFSGSNSTLATTKFFLKSPVALMVQIAGTGSGSASGTSAIAGDAAPTNGALLNVGESYSITATPRNSYFSSWSGTAGTTNGPKLNFIMQSNTSLTANFVTNIFIGMAGIYNGLFSNAVLGVTAETAGMISGLTLATNGVYSATLNLAGSSPKITGTFTHDGYATNTLVATAGGKVTVELQVIPSAAPRTITGVVIGTNTVLANGEATAGWTSDVILVASLADTSVDPGSYTLLIPPVSSLPPGTGFAVLTNRLAKGAAPASMTISGALADGAVILQTVPIGEDNGVPVYQIPYGNGASGLLFGRLNLPVNVPPGSLTWIRKASASGVFKAGFSNNVVLEGSVWSPVLAGGINGSVLTLGGANLQEALNVTLSLSKTNLTGTISGNSAVTGSVNTNTGQFTIQFFDNGVKVTGLGALLDSGAGDGFFILGPTAAPTNAGSMQLIKSFVPDNSR